MKIFVGGSLRDVPRYGEPCREFVGGLAARILERGHTVLTGCRGSLDRALAEAARDWLEANNKDARSQLISYRLKNDEPAHRLGRIHVSRRADWELTHPNLAPPEQIAEADVTIFIAGRDGTFSAANWARIADKPVLGIAQFGGSGEAIFERERDRFKERYADLVEVQDFDILSQDTVEVDELAADVVELCERVVMSNSVFAIMPFAEQFRDVYASYSTVCDEYGFTAERTDMVESGERVIPRILHGIRRSAFVIADVTESSANVFYEIGFAEGAGKPVIVTARKGTELPFDIVDIPVLLWSGQEELKDKLRGRIEDIVRPAHRQPR